MKIQDQFIEYGVRIDGTRVPSSSWTTDHGEAVRTAGAWQHVLKRGDKPEPQVEIVERAVVIRSTDWFEAKEPYLTSSQQYENSKRYDR